MSQYTELLRRVKILERRIPSGGGGAGTPGAHANSHSDGGTDEIDVTDLGGFPGGTTNFLRADATFAAPSASAFSGAMVRKAADLTGQNLTSLTPVSWDTESYDTDAWFDIGAPTLLTVPSGVTRVNIGAALRIANCASGNFVSIAVRKNGTGDYDGVPEQTMEVSAAITFNISCAGIGVPCVAGDDFDLVVLVEADTSVDIDAERSWFSIQAVG